MRALLRRIAEANRRAYAESLARAMDGTEVPSAGPARARRRPRLTEAAGRSPAGPACPRCGGTHFEAKRSGRGKAIGALAGGAGVLLAPKSRVRCVTCGEEYRRG